MAIDKNLGGVLKANRKVTYSVPRRRIVLVVVLLAVFMAVSNVFIVNVASAALQKGLNCSFSDVQLIIASYTLAFAVSLILGGRLGDRYGRKRMILVGVTGFMVLSLLCAFATRVDELVFFRALQGFSAALIFPQALSLIQVNFSPSERRMAFGLYGATNGIAATTGQIIGGLILQWDLWGLDWRAVFLFSIPLGIVTLALGLWAPESNDVNVAKVDWIGAITVATGLLLMTYPLVEGQNRGWPLTLNLCLVFSIPVLTLFVIYENRLARRNGEPLMKIHLFKNESFSTGILIAFFTFSPQAAFLLVFSYYLQVGVGFSALKSGLVFVPMGISYFLSSLVSAKGVTKMGTYILTLGSVLSVAGYLTVAYTVHITAPTLYGYEFIPPLVLIGAGQGFISAPLTSIILSRVQTSDIGSASGTLTTGMQIANAFGTAFIGIVLLQALGHNPMHWTIQMDFSHAFIRCLWVIALFTTATIPLVIKMSRKKRVFAG